MIVTMRKKWRIASRATSARFMLLANFECELRAARAARAAHCETEVRAARRTKAWRAEEMHAERLGQLAPNLARSAGSSLSITARFASRDATLLHTTRVDLLIVNSLKEIITFKG